MIAILDSIITPGQFRFFELHLVIRMTCQKSNPSDLDVQIDLFNSGVCMCVRACACVRISVCVRVCVQEQNRVSLNI